MATQFLDGLWQAQRQAPSQAALILELSGLYRRPDFIAALERAVRFGAYSLSSVRRILEINARPKSALESLLDSPGEPLTSLSDISAPPRPMSAYQSLSCTNSSMQRFRPPNPVVILTWHFCGNCSERRRLTNSTARRNRTPFVRHWKMRALHHQRRFDHRPDRIAGGWNTTAADLVLDEI